jgi:hypothetical protein
MTILDAKVFSYNWCPMMCTQWLVPADRTAACQRDYRLWREKGDRLVLSFDMNHWRHYYFDYSEPPEVKMKKMMGLFLRLDASVQRLNFSKMPPRSEGGTCGM